MHAATHQYLPLHQLARHLFIELDGALWLVDTGAPFSFGEQRVLPLGSGRFKVPRTRAGVSAAVLSAMLAVDCAGLLGADVLGRFDFRFEPASDRVAVSAGRLDCAGRAVRLAFSRGIPIVRARIGDQDCRVYFDTGAQWSYLDPACLADSPSGGCVTDFYPGLGRFEVETFLADCALGERRRTLRFGILPDALRDRLDLAGTLGILGNELLLDAPWGYFPRRHSLVL